MAMVAALSADACTFSIVATLSPNSGGQGRCSRLGRFVANALSMHVSQRAADQDALQALSERLYRQDDTAIRQLKARHVLPTPCKSGVWFKGPASVSVSYVPAQTARM
jgi:hypothetical protein